MKKSIKFLPLLSMGLVVVGCQDYDAGFTESDIKAHQYTEDFKKEFGNIDPNQDWSMAANLTAKVNLEENVNGTLEIYTKAPGLEGCYLLAAAKVEDGQANIQFDAIKGSELLYARIVKEGRNLVAGYYHVENGSINLSAGLTRTAPDASGIGVTLTPFEKNVWRMHEDAVEAVKNLDKYPADYNNWTNGGEYSLNSREMQNTFVLSGFTSTKGAEYTYEQLISVFGNKMVTPNIAGVFTEGEDHIEKYVKDGTLELDASLVVAEDGPVSMELIWRGTQFPDAFGYFFYPTDGSPLTTEYFWNTNKYIIFGGVIDEQGQNEVNALSSLTQYNNYQAASSSYDGWQNLNGMQASSNMGADPRSLMRGTKVNLIDFTAETPTYEFTKGTKIGFFLYSTQNTKPQLVFSDTKLNYELNYSIYRQGASSEENSKTSRPYAVTFNYKGNTFLGFADGSGDYDLNDLVFGAFNVVPANEIPDDDPDPEAITWMVACEDLGGTFDYDFNDLVFGLRKKPNFDVSKSTVELIPYAAGGTLEAHVIYDGEDKGEIHKLVGGSSASTSTPLNVDDYQASVTPGAAVVLTSDIASTTSINEIANNVMVKVETDAASNYYLTKSDYNGEKAPQMILFQAGWDWPSEGVDIRNLYPDFANWVAESAYTNWYMSKDEDFAYVTSPLAKPTTGGGSDSGNGGSDGGNGSQQPTGTDLTTTEPYVIKTCSVYDGGTDPWGGTIPAGVSVPFAGYNAPSSNMKATLKLTLTETLGNQVLVYTSAGSTNKYLQYYGGNTEATVQLSNAELATIVSDGSFIISGLDSEKFSSVTITIIEE